MRNRLIYSSESWLVACILSLSGGLQDAYSFLLRGEVFANAQTGNIVLLGRDIFSKNFVDAVRYIIPICAFACGIFISELIRSYAKKLVYFHWQQYILIFEAAILFIVGLLPTSYNHAANALISFACAMQVQSFRYVSGKPYASTMCIGNIRSSVEHFFCAWQTKSKIELTHALGLLFIIILFGVGAGVGYVLSTTLKLSLIWISSLLLILALCTIKITKES